MKRPIRVMIADPDPPKHITYNSDLVRQYVDLVDAAIPTANQVASPATKLISAESDAQAVVAFLAEYAGSPNTVRSYQKELERLLLWSRLIARKGLAKLTRDDVEALRAFWRSPPTDWINPSRAQRYSQDWRPFRAPLTGQSLRHAELVCNSFFEWLVSARYLTANPFSLIRRRTRDRGRSIKESMERARRHQLSDVAIAHANRWLAALPEQPQQALIQKRRMQAILAMYLLTGARRSELAAARTSHFEQLRGRWWLTLVRKGGKLDSVPIVDAAVAALSAYRQAMGLSPFIEVGEDLPIFAHLSDHRSAITDGMIARIVKTILFGAAGLAHTTGDHESAHILERATTHWLRHTSVGRVVEASNDLVLGKRLACHESIQTTSIYSTSGDDEFHDRATVALNNTLGRALATPRG